MTSLKLYIRKTAVAYIVFLIFFTIIAANVFAQPPSAGSILSEERQQRVQRSIQRLSPTPPGEEVVSPPESAVGPDIKIFVKRIEFTGYESLILLKELDKIAAPYVGKETSFNDLQFLAQVITIDLREKKGFLLARAYLPQQDVTEGTVKIAIIAGRLDGEVGVSVQEPYRINKRLLEKIASNKTADGASILTKNVERAVLLINNLPGMSARAYLDKGKSPGTTRVSINCNEDRLFHGMIYGDNFGNNSTGAFRRIAQITLNDPLHCGDILQMTYINSNYLNQGAGYFSFPLGAQGLFLDLSCNGLHYKLAGKLANLDANGSAVTSSANMRYPLILTRQGSLWVGGGYDYLWLEDRIGDIAYSGRNISAGNASVTGSFF